VRVHRMAEVGRRSVALIVRPFNHWNAIKLLVCFEQSPHYSSVSSTDEGAFGDMGVYRSKAPLDLRHCTRKSHRLSCH